MTPSRSRVSFCLVMALFAPAPDAELCKPGSRPQTTPTERFALHPNGTALDKNTGLTWMRCALGQTWDGDTCAGQAAVYTWQDTDWAKDTVNLDGFAGRSDWRVPVVPELASIVELQCADPRINLTVFPRTPSVVFWSSMEKPGSVDVAYAMDFGPGGVAPTLKSTPGALRLVRGGPWWTPAKPLAR